MSLDDTAIERLVEEAQSGDAWAFGRLFDHYHLSIHRYVASRVRRPSDAEDLTQLVFVKALEALPRYESRGIPFGGWLFRLARNAVIDFMRTSHEHADLAQSVDREGATPPHLVDRPGTRSVEQRAAVGATEQGRGQVDDVAVDQMLVGLGAAHAQVTVGIVTSLSGPVSSIGIPYDNR